MRAKYGQLLPSLFELWYVVLGSFGLLVVGCAKAVMQHYGVIGASVYVNQHLSTTIGDGLQYVDSFTFTPGLITFLTWSIIGMLLFSFIQALLRATGTLQFERDVSSNRYVHPVSFNRKRYWHNILSDITMSLGLLIALIFYSTMYLLFIVPVSFSYTQHFLLNTSLSNLPLFFLGVFTIFAGSLLLYTIVKAFIWHHRISVR